MADTGNEQATTAWPLPQYQFTVKIGDVEASFQEITGFVASRETFEISAGVSNGFSTIKIPRVKTPGNITLKKGIFKDDKSFYTLFNAVKLNVFQRETISISLLDEKNSVIILWTLTNAFPAKISSVYSKGNGNEVAVELMELSHEGLSINTGK